MRYHGKEWLLILSGIIFLFVNTPAVAADYSTDVEVLTQGVVHEAFAEPIVFDPEPGIVISQSPPAAIEELPPDEKPEGDNVVWIPGYWSWDDDRDAFIWVSGIWRIPPANLSWIPGYWSAVENGYQWTNGFWKPTADEEIEYLPSPPTSRETGPIGDAPSSEFVWVPGYWHYDHGYYIWRRGYWLQCQAHWIWVPPHYVWTHRGYVFVDGYWDRSLLRRGVLFAPVYIHHRAVVAPLFVYRPSIVISSDVITINLFSRPRYCHYYFGDYYDTVYVTRGVYPWFECEMKWRWYDPVFVHEKWRRLKKDPHWGDNQRDHYQRAVKDRSLRPERTFSEHQERLKHIPEKDRRERTVAEPLKDFSSRWYRAPIRMEKVSRDNKEKLELQSRQLSRYRNERTELEKPVSDEDKNRSRSKVMEIRDKDGGRDNEKDKESPRTEPLQEIKHEQNLGNRDRDAKDIRSTHDIKEDKTNKGNKETPVAAEPKDRKEPRDVKEKREVEKPQETKPVKETRAKEASTDREKKSERDTKNDKRAEPRIDRVANTESASDEKREAPEKTQKVRISRSPIEGQNTHEKNVREKPPEKPKESDAPAKSSRSGESDKPSKESKRKTSDHK